MYLFTVYNYHISFFYPFTPCRSIASCLQIFALRLRAPAPQRSVAWALGPTSPDPRWRPTLRGPMTMAGDVNECRGGKWFGRVSPVLVFHFRVFLGGFEHGVAQTSQLKQPPSDESGDKSNNEIRFVCFKASTHKRRHRSRPPKISIWKLWCSCSWSLLPDVSFLSEWVSHFGRWGSLWQAWRWMFHQLLNLDPASPKSGPRSSPNMNTISLFRAQLGWGCSGWILVMCIKVSRCWGRFVASCGKSAFVHRMVCVSPSHKDCHPVGETQEGTGWTWHFSA